MEELKPCPFCGSKPHLLERKCDETKYAIGCSNIECIIWLPKDARKRELHNYASCWVEKKDAIKAWNTRKKNNKALHMTPKAEPKCACHPHDLAYYGCRCK